MGWLVKKKANSMKERIAKLAKLAEEKDKEETEENNDEGQASSVNDWKTKTKEEYFGRVLKSSTCLDRVLEILRFRKQVDKLLPSVGSDLLNTVKQKT